MDQVLKAAEKSILEPIMNVEVTFPNEFEQRVNMLLLDRHVEVESTETDFLVRQTFNKINKRSLEFSFCDSELKEKLIQQL